MSNDARAMIQRVFHLHGNHQTLPWGSSVRYGRDLFPILFAKLQFNFGAEVGVRRGSFSEKLCKANPDLKLQCIDPWMAYNRYTQEKQDALYATTVSRLAPYPAVIVRKTSMDALPLYADSSLDFVYIDGDHSFDMVMQDIIHWSHKLRRGGIMAIHDYNYGRGLGVIQAVNAYTRAHNINPWYVTKEAQPTAYWVKA